MDREVKTIGEFKHWVQVQLAIKQTSQKEIAERMQVAYPRISEAVNGRKTGRKHIVPLIEQLGGNIEDFKAII